MEKLEQRFVIKFLFLKGLSANAIYKELSTVLGLIAYSFAQVKNWCTRFTEGDLTCSDQLRTGRPRHMLGMDLSQFLQEFLFAM
jgi:transposase